jgi:predicted CopG family antitoxin
LIPLKNKKIYITVIIVIIIINNMENTMNTTISVSYDIREQIKEFGNKGETYDEILVRLLNKAKERQLQDLLMDTGDSIPIGEALERAKKKWHK